jgi:hypothetical protein
MTIEEDSPRAGRVSERWFGGTKAEDKTDMKREGR